MKEIIDFKDDLWHELFLEQGFKLIVKYSDFHSPDIRDIFSDIKEQTMIIINI